MIDEIEKRRCAVAADRREHLAERALHDDCGEGLVPPQRLVADEEEATQQAGEADRPDARGIRRHETASQVARTARKPEFGNRLHADNHNRLGHDLPHDGIAARVHGFGSRPRCDG